MKVVQIARTGGPDVLDVVEVPTPSPGPGEVLVKADAIGVNYFDTMIRSAATGGCRSCRSFWATS